MEQELQMNSCSYIKEINHEATLKTPKNNSLFLNSQYFRKSTCYQIVMYLLPKAPASLLQSSSMGITSICKNSFHHCWKEEEAAQCRTEKVCTRLMYIKSSSECMHSCARITVAKPITTHKIQLIFFFFCSLLSPHAIEGLYFLSDMP